MSIAEVDDGVLEDILNMEAREAEGTAAEVQLSELVAGRSVALEPVEPSSL